MLEYFFYVFIKDKDVVVVMCVCSVNFDVFRDNLIDYVENELFSLIV